MITSRQQTHVCIRVAKQPGLYLMTHQDSYFRVWRHKLALPLVADDITGEAAPDDSLTPGRPKGSKPNQNTGDVVWALPWVSSGRAPRVISIQADHVTRVRRFAIGVFPSSICGDCYPTALVDCFVGNSLLVGDESRFAARRLRIHAKR